MFMVYLSDVIKDYVQIDIFITSLRPITVLWVTLETAILVATFTPLFYDFFA